MSKQEGHSWKLQLAGDVDADELGVEISLDGEEFGLVRGGFVRPDADSL